MRQVTKVILSHKLAGTAAETSAGAGLAAGTSPPSLLPRFTTPGVGGASGSGLLGWRLQAERWPVEPQDKSESKVRWEQGSRCPPWQRQRRSIACTRTCASLQSAARSVREQDPHGSAVRHSYPLQVSHLLLFLTFVSHFSPGRCTKKDRG